MVEIQDKQSLLLSSDASVFRQQLSTVLDCMRDELDDHRLAINENTSELSDVYEFMNELSRKLDKLAERLDDIALRTQGEKAKKAFELQPLSSKEKEVFLALYTLTEAQPFASYDQLAKRSLQAKDIVSAHIASMIEKGVPVHKKLDKGMMFLTLDPLFRQLQAKENLVGLDAPLTSWM